MELEIQKSELISQGAEARVYREYFLEDLCIVKERFSKKYRNEILDKKITYQRTVQEARNMARARKAGVNTPYVMHVDTETHKIYMQYVNDAVMIKEYFYFLQRHNLAFPEHVLAQLGRAIGLIHNCDIVHGDLTTSNMMIKFNTHEMYQNVKNDVPFTLTAGEYSIYLIDFGLSYVSSNAEDKAVDLYVLEKAFLSTHTENQSDFSRILDFYQSEYKNGDKILARFAEVQKRGRKRLAFG